MENKQAAESLAKLGYRTDIHGNAYPVIPNADDEHAITQILAPYAGEAVAAEIAANAVQQVRNIEALQAALGYL